MKVFLKFHYGWRVFDIKGAQDLADAAWVQDGPGALWLGVEYKESEENDKGF